MCFRFHLKIGVGRFIIILDSKSKCLGVRDRTRRPTISGSGLPDPETFPYKWLGVQQYGIRTTRPKDNSPQDNSPHIQKTTRPIFRRQLTPPHFFRRRFREIILFSHVLNSCSSMALVFFHWYQRTFTSDTILICVGRTETSLYRSKIRR